MIAAYSVPLLSAGFMALFLSLVPCLMGMIHLLIGLSDGSALRVCVAKNGRLYAYRAGRPGIVWGRKGETSLELLNRAMSAVG